jgi:regulatory protein
MSYDATSLEAARAVAYRYLGHSARSRAEMERRLTRAEFTPEVIEKVLAELEARNWLDDTKFAQDWVEDRADRKKYGRKRLAQELRQRGVDKEDIEAAIDSIDAESEVARARAAAETRWDAETLQKADFDTRQAEKRRMANFLQRRGFSWNIIEQVFREFFSNKE